MTQQDPKIDGRTKRALDMAIARKQVSQESYRAVIAGTLTLQEAKAMGRDGSGTAVGTARSAGAEDTGVPPRLCICGCGEPVRGKKSRFRPGHDARLHGEIKRNLEKDPLLRNERFTDTQRAYARERGLI